MKGARRALGGSAPESMPDAGDMNISGTWIYPLPLDLSAPSRSPDREVSTVYIGRNKSDQALALLAPFGSSYKGVAGGARGGRGCVPGARGSHGHPWAQGPRPGIAAGFPEEGGGQREGVPGVP